MVAVEATGQNTSDSETAAQYLALRSRDYSPLHWSVVVQTRMRWVGVNECNGLFSAVILSYKSN